MESILREALDRLGGQDIELEGLLTARLLRLSLRWPDEDELTAQLDRAISTTDSDSLRLRRLALRGAASSRRGDLTEAAREAERCIELAQQLGDIQAVTSAMFSWCSALLAAGGLEAGLAACSEAHEYCMAHRQRQMAGFMNQFIGTVYLLRGEFDSLRETLEHIPEENFTREQLTGYLLTAMGHHAEAIEHMPPRDWPGNDLMMSAVRGGRARVLWHAGEIDAAREAFNDWLAIQAPDRPSDTGGEWGAWNMDETFHELAGEAQQDALIEQIEREPSAELRAIAHCGSFDRLVAQLYFFRGRLPEARRYLAAAIEWSTEQRAVVELARSEQLLGELELQEGNTEEALRLLDSAAVTYSKLGLGLYLDQVIAKKQILKA